MSGLSLIMGNKNYSSWSLRPWIFLKHNQIPFVEKRVPLFTENTQGELSAYGSDCKVPVLKDDELVLWDSLAILEYLSEQHLSSKGWPQNTKARALARSVSNEMHSSFSHVRNEMPMNCRKRFPDFTVSAGAKKEIDRIQGVWKQCRDQYGGEGEWLFGEYSITDAMFAPVALRFHGYCVDLDEGSTAYVQSVLNQPAIKEWIRAGELEKEIIDVDEIDV